MLVVAWLVAAMRDHGPYPVLVDQRRTGRRQVGVLTHDASRWSIRAPRRSGPCRRTIATSSCPPAIRGRWYSTICRACRRGLPMRCVASPPAAASPRACCTPTAGEMIFDAVAADHAQRHSLAHRSRRPGRPRGDDPPRRQSPKKHATAEDEIDRRSSSKARPVILGALLDAVSGALRNLDKVKLDRSPRMADLAKWITAAEPALGWEAGRIPRRLS